AALAIDNTGLVAERDGRVNQMGGGVVLAVGWVDVALADRLRLQVGYMESRAGCGGLGAPIRFLRPGRRPTRDDPEPLDHETVDAQTLAGSGASIRQPVALFRTDAIRHIGGYRDECFTHEETDLYLRLAEIGRLANLPDVLLLYRLRLGSINR